MEYDSVALFSSLVHIFSCWKTFGQEWILDFLKICSKTSISGLERASDHRNASRILICDDPPQLKTSCRAIAEKRHRRLAPLMAVDSRQFGRNHHKHIVNNIQGSPYAMEPIQCPFIKSQRALSCPEENIWAVLSPPPIECD
jgi:hypothetical protein